MKRFLALLFGVLMLAGCSRGGEASSGRPKLVVGMECNYAPFNWTQVTGSDTAVSLGGAGYADGYDVVVAAYLAQQLGLELEVKRIEWTGLEPALSSGEIDAIIAGMTDTPQRRENVDFTSPYYQSEMVCIVRKDDPLATATSITDFSGKRVLGQLNTLYDAVIDQIEGVIHVTPQQTYPLMVVALQQKEVDALTAELPVATGVVAANPDLSIVRFAEGQGFVSDTSVSIAVKKGNTQLLEQLEAALAGISEAQRLEWMTAAVNRQPAA